MSHNSTRPNRGDGDDENEMLNEKTVKPIRRFLTPLLTKKVPLVPDESERKVIPIHSANILSRVFFTWLIPLFNVGYKRTLEFNDLWKVDEKSSIEHNYSRFKYYLSGIQAEENKTKENKDDISKWALYKALFYTFRSDYCLAVLLAMLNYGAQVVSPVLVKKLIEIVEVRVVDTSFPLGVGVGYVVGITLLTVFSALCRNYWMFLTEIVGGNSRMILTKSLLEKVTKASDKTRHDFSNGKVFALMSSDLSKIDSAIAIFPILLCMPIPSVVAIVLLIVNLGAPALAGIGVFLVTIISFGIPAVFIMKYKKISSTHTDKRVGLMRQVLNAMKMIKLYSWEDAYQKQIIDERTKESKYIFRSDFIINITFGGTLNISLVSSMTAFLVLYAIRSNHGSVGSIFASLALYNIFSITTTELPFAISECAAGHVSMNRLREYLAEPIIQEVIDEKISVSEDIAVQVVDGDFEWKVFSEDENEINKQFKLKKINLEVKRGELIIVTGSVGSGKSSLLHAITGTMTKTNGSVCINGSAVFYDTPWIQSTTIRENILFGSPYDSVLYHKVVEACSLETDINSLQAGDLTEVGERGVTLSGGQKARVSLARAIYSQKDIYFLDDVLSAVDAKVGKHIVERCLLGLIKEKTKVLVTHQLALAYKADRIVFLNEDGTIDVGSVDELKKTNEKFRTLINSSNLSTKAEIDSEAQGTNSVKIENLKENEGEDGHLFDDEEKAVNSIPLSIYRQYIKAGAGTYARFFVPLMIVVSAISVFSTIFSNVWLSFWIDSKFKGRGGGFYIAIYVLMIVSAMFWTMLLLSMIGGLCVYASKRLNLDAVGKVLHTPMSFLDTTPSGRILNRFTKDTSSLDNEIGNQFKMLIYMTSMIVGILILCVIYLPWFAIAIPLLVLVFFVVLNYYQSSSREIKRLEALQRSFLYNNFNEVLNGLSTIKAFDSEHRFLEKNDHLLDRVNEAYMITVVNQKWIGVALQLTGSGVVFLVIMLALTGQFHISAASTGLITTYVLTLGDLLSDCLLAFSECENEMNSVERLCYYANNLDQEAPSKIPGREPAPEWPQHGGIKFTDVKFRYRDGLPFVLQDMNIDIKPHEKIGICGRTGAGKSSLITTIYRLAELTEGKIEIDGVDIRNLGLHDLRSKLSIIPQDPAIFEGTIRKNLDPFGEKSDMELWDALKRGGLIGNVDISTLSKSHKFHLDSIVEDEGSNFSLGERQLIALARALVRHSRILIMDEATSSVDYATDALVQKTISNEFKDRTVLCVAHRLKTILKHDRIMVMEKGEVREFDTPLQLYKKGGIFREMCDSADITGADFSD